MLKKVNKKWVASLRLKNTLVSEDSLSKLCKEYLNPNKIFFGESDKYGSTSFYPETWIMHINDTHPPRQQILTMMHEVCHFHNRFLNYSIKILNEGFVNEEIENQITTFARKILRERKDIAEIARNAYTKAKEINRELPF